MNRSEIESLAQSATYKGEPMEGNVDETHISWVLFSRNYVFKIKKPVQLSFLDFSTLAKRRHFCERELALNRRFSGIYLDVLPVMKENGHWSLETGEGEIMDYAVLMERMESGKRMDLMLRENTVRLEDMETLARVVAGFHQRAAVIYSSFDLGEAKSLFRDIQQINPYIERTFGSHQREFILRSMDRSDQFLEKHTERIRERHQQGFVRDLHGDLHGGNIFLYPEPVLFDCIEFSEEYRQIDVLYEIAFLCMEMEAGGHRELSDHFFKHYNQLFSCMETPADLAMFSYFKCLRANIRAKVLGIRAAENQNRETQDNQAEAIEIYLSLMEKYMKGI